MRDENDRSEPCGCRWIRWERFDCKHVWQHVVACPDHHDLSAPPWAVS